jgi:hypothetical protein
MDIGDVIISRAEYDKILAEVSKLYGCHKIIRSLGVMFNNPSELQVNEAAVDYYHWIRDNPIASTDPQHWIKDNSAEI